MFGLPQYSFLIAAAVFLSIFIILGLRNVVGAGSAPRSGRGGWSMVQNISAVLGIVSFLIQVFEWVRPLLR